MLCSPSQTTLTSLPLLPTRPHQTPHPSSTGCPDKQTLLVMAPWHESTESSLSVNASSAPHSLFLDQTDVRDYPPAHRPNPSTPPLLISTSPPIPKLLSSFQGNEHARETTQTHKQSPRAKYQIGTKEENYTLLSFKNYSSRLIICSVDFKLITHLFLANGTLHILNCS